MISRSRSAPTDAAMSIECTTSANSTVTCLYSADRVACVTGAPHSLQNLELGGSSVPHDPQNSPVAVSPPPPSPLGSTSVSFHCWSAMSVVSLCHLRHEGLRPSYVVSFETAAHLARLSPEHRVIVSYRRGKTKKTRIAPGLLDRVYRGSISQAMPSLSRSRRGAS